MLKPTTNPIIKSQKKFITINNTTFWWTIQCIFRAKSL